MVRSVSIAVPEQHVCASQDFGNLDANLRFLDDSGLLESGMKVLEIGCGRGTLLHRLSARGVDIVGVEISPARIEESRSLYDGLRIYQTSGIELPFADEAFDIVLSFDVLEHIPDTDAHLAEVRRVLKPAGWLLLQTPNKWTNAIFETIRWRSLSKWRVDHCSLHNYWQLTRRLSAFGFDVSFSDVKVVTPFYREKIRQYLGAPGLLLLKLVNPDRFPIPLRTNFYVRSRKQRRP